MMPRKIIPFESQFLQYLQVRGVCAQENTTLLLHHLSMVCSKLNGFCNFFPPSDLLPSLPCEKLNVKPASLISHNGKNISSIKIRPDL